MGQRCEPPQATTMTPRLALGTVQFGLRYGVANQAGRVTSIEAAAILKRARAAGVDMLDTAVAYGDSEAALGSIGIADWRVISKLPPLPPEVMDVSQWARTHTEASLRRLGVAHLEALLLHRSADLLGARGVSLQQALDSLQQEGCVQAVGVSIYDPTELDAFWPVWRPQLIQAPFNVLDRRLVLSGWLDRLARHGVRVHARSIFLQGLLLMQPPQRPAWFAPWRGVLDDWLEWCRQRRCSPLQAALALVQSTPGIERMVVGVDTVRQLEEILDAAVANVPPVPSELISDDRDLIEPRRWSVA